MNETNWLTKLLVKAAQIIPKTPEGHAGAPEEHASFGLTVLLAMTLIGKIYEGWETMRKGELKATIDSLRITKRQPQAHEFLYSSGKPASAA